MPQRFDQLLRGQYTAAEVSHGIMYCFSFTDSNKICIQQLIIPSVTRVLEAVLGVIVLLSYVSVCRILVKDAFGVIQASG